MSNRHVVRIGKSTLRMKFETKHTRERERERERDNLGKVGVGGEGKTEMNQKHRTCTGCNLLITVCTTISFLGKALLRSYSLAYLELKETPNFRTITFVSPFVIRIY